MSRSAPTDPAPNSSAEPAEPPGEGRDARGRFTAGNKYGPGNPFARQTAQLRKVLLEVVTPEELRQVAFALLLRAKTGNLTAIKLLLQYVIGKPAEAVDPERLEVEEWKLSQESRVNPVAVKETVDHLPAEAANVLVRHAWPASTETNYLSAAREELEAMDREDAERARAAQEKPTEANGDNGEGERSAKPQAAGPQPRPVALVGQAFEPDAPKSQARKPDLQGRGEQEARGGGAAREGRRARLRAARRGTEANGGNGGRAAGGAPSTSGGDGGVRRRSPPGRPR